MNRQEFFNFMATTAKIEIDRETGAAYTPINSFMAGHQGAIEAIELENLVNATVELCRSHLATRLGSALGLWQLESMRQALDELKIK